jgi:hypothetical protein
VREPGERNQQVYRRYDDRFEVGYRDSTCLRTGISTRATTPCGAAYEACDLMDLLLDSQTGRERLHISLGPYAPEGSPIVAHAASLLTIVIGPSQRAARLSQHLWFRHPRGLPLGADALHQCAGRLHATAYELMAQSGQPEARELVAETAGFFQDLLAVRCPIAAPVWAGTALDLSCLLG